MNKIWNRRFPLKLSFMGLAAAVVITFGAYCQSAPEQSKKDQMAALVRAYVETGQFQGSVTALVNNDLIFDQAYGKANIEAGLANTPDTRFYAASITKALTAVAVLQLVEAEKLALDAPIGQFFPALTSDMGETVTVRHLLMHTSGVMRDHTERLGGKENPTTADLMQVLNEAPLNFEPGTSGSYSNTGYHLLALILQRVSGHPFAGLIQEKILTPAGMTNSSIGQLDEQVGLYAAGYKSDDILTPKRTAKDDYDRPMLFGASGLFTTSRDLIAFTRALKGDSLLGLEMAEIMFTPRDGRSTGQVMGWEIIHKDDQLGTLMLATGAADGFLSSLFWVKGSDTAVAVMANHSKLGRVGSQALSLNSLRIAIGAGPQLAAPATPLAIYLSHILAGEHEAAADYVKTLDWSKAPLANAAAIQAVGEPNGGVGESRRAWAPATADAGEEWIKLDFDAEKPVTAVRVQFTQIPESLTGVEFDGVKVEASPVHTVADNGAPVVEFRLSAPRTISSVKILLETKKVKGWPQIDAVSLIAEDGSVTWARDATSSTSAFRSSGVSLHDYPSKAVLRKLAERLRESGKKAEADKVENAMK
ncbi:MAG: hypothetical protein COB37_10650 [Kordiimonadales bacterium]|nr:MAG: hypothetical protein COB37_10650 [Kordiimonadales bacterium]